MTNFSCPVCKKELKKRDKSLICENAHLFDISKKGYVNLLMSNSSKNHGDTKEMLSARQRFLNKGYYEPLKDAICRACTQFANESKSAVDCGCGEGYYTAAVANVLPQTKIYAVDVSKQALILAKKRCPEISAAAASSYSLPLPDGSIDLLLNIFSPLAAEEFHRVLKRGGILLRAIPLEDHLWELKQAVYEKPYKNEVKTPQLTGFSFVTSKRIEYQFDADQPTLCDLFTMTPYSIKTSIRDSEKLKSLTKLNITAQFEIQVYAKD